VYYDIEEKMARTKGKRKIASSSCICFAHRRKKFASSRGEIFERDRRNGKKTVVKAF